MSNLDFRERVWRTANHKSIMVKDMELGHLVNVINWIIDNEESYPAGLVDTVFIPEANYRKVFQFAEGKAYAGLVDGRWQIIDPQTGTGTIEKPPKEYIDAVEDNETYQRMAKRTQQKRSVAKKQQD